MKQKLFGIMAIVAIIAIALIACDDGKNDTHTHQWQWVVTTHATTTADGLETETCSTCGATRGTRPIAKLPFTNIEDITAYLASQPDNTLDTPYELVLSGIAITDLTEGTEPIATDPLGKLFAAFDGKYINLDLSNCDWDTIPSINLIIVNRRPDKDKIVSLSLPRVLVTIGNLAFESCGSITSITIPDSVTNIGYRAFGVCTSLTTIHVANANTAYSTEDGVLYTKDKTTLHTYPAGKTGSTFTIPNSVTTIGSSAFRNCYVLTSVTIPNSVTSIGDTAFYGCSFINITIPDSVTTIGQMAFRECYELISVTIGANVILPEINEAFMSIGNLTSVYEDNVKQAGTYTRLDRNSTTWTKVE